MKILLTIAARGGSKGVPNKNIRSLQGKPLIAHSIDHARKWSKADCILVTTDSEEIRKVAVEYGAEAPFLRPSELASDTSGKIPALRHALLEIEKLKGHSFDVIVDLDPTAPLRRIRDIDECLELFLREKCDNLFSVTKSMKNPYFNMVEKRGDGFVHLCKKLGNDVLRRQDAPEVFSINGSIYVYDRNWLANGEMQTVVSAKSLIYCMDDLSGVDIDREIDFRFIEFLMKEGIWPS